MSNCMNGIWLLLLTANKTSQTTIILYIKHEGTGGGENLAEEV